MKNLGDLLKKVCVICLLEQYNWFFLSVLYRYFSNTPLSFFIKLNLLKYLCKI